MIINKNYYIIYRDATVLRHGKRRGTVCPGRGRTFAEFDTEAEMLEYIKTNGLIVPEHGHVEESGV